jgi:hypothetical protein
MTDREALEHVLFLSLVQFSCGPLNAELAPQDRLRVLRVIKKLSRDSWAVEEGVSGAGVVRGMLPLLEEIAGVEPSPPGGPETIWDRLEKADG